MKPWQLMRAHEPERSAPAPETTFAGFRVVFDEDAQFWRAYGARAPNVFQFEIGQTPSAERWYISLDERGARVESGEHEHPTITWRSSKAAFSAAFSGEHDDDDPVYISGGVGPLQDLLRAIAQA